jgi:hypothetical protein
MTLRNRRLLWLTGAAAPVLIAVVGIVACNKPAAVTPSNTGDEGPALPKVPSGPPMFEDKTAGSGIKFKYDNGEETRHFAILESLGGGAAVFDFDGDGLLDIFVPGGGHFDPQESAEFLKKIEAYYDALKNDPKSNPPWPKPPKIMGYPGKLYRNKGNFQFEDVTAQVGLDKQPDVYTHGVAVGDYDRDGWPDLLVTGYGRVTLWHNEPDGKGGRKFVDVSAKAGLLGANPAKLSEESGQLGDHFWSTSAAFGDLDGDGYPEIYLCQYVNWSFASSKTHPLCPGYTSKRPDGTPIKQDVCPPKQFNSVPHALWRNNRDGTFTNVTREAGIRVEREDADYGKGLGVVFIDVNGDGKPDIYVCNDTTDNFLYMNQSTPGHLKFEEKGVQLGVAKDFSGISNGSMGVDAADYDGSGRPSIFVTNYEGEYHALYRNIMANGRLAFSFNTQVAGLSALGQIHVGFGTRFVDIDNDGWEDLLIANGHVVKFPPRDNMFQKPVLFMNLEFQSRSGVMRRFSDASPRGGSYFADGHRGRALAIGDFDNDGRTDLVFVGVGEPVSILRNVASPENGWLGVDLRGKANRDIVGARLTLEVGGRKLVRFIRGGGSYLSAHDQRVIFGLGSENQVGKLTIEWPGAEKHIQVVEHLEPRKYHRIDEK